MRDGGGAGRRWFASLSMAPVAVCVVCAFAFSYDAPYWDEWVYVEPIAKAFEGTLGFSDFIVQVNEHVYVTPNFFTIPLARLTHWNIRAEIAAILLLYLGTFALLVGQLRKVDRAGSLWAAPVLALALFSPAQHAMWNWGLHVSLAMAVLFIVLVLVLLSGKNVGWWTMVAAIAAGWAATFSIGGGLAVWPAGVLAVATTYDRERRVPASAAGAWLVAGVLASMAYIFLSKAQPGDVNVRPADMPDVVLYVLAFAGGPVAAYSGAVAVFSGLPIAVANGVMVRRRLSSFAIGLGAAALVAALLTALKHVHEGVDNAISSRFLPWGTLAWCGLAIAAYAEWPTVRAMPRAVRAAVLIVVVGLLTSWGYGVYKAEERHDAFSLGRRALIEDPASSDMKFIHPDPKTLGERRALLVKYRLTVFRDQARAD